MTDIRDQPTSPTLLGQLRHNVSDEAWNRFVDRYAGAIFSWASGIGLQDSDAADVTQEVLLKLLNQLRTFQYQADKGSFRGWLKTVTVNAAKDCGRKLTRSQCDSAGLSKVGNTGGFEDLEKRIEQEYKNELLQQARQIVKAKVQPKTWEAFHMTAELQQSASDAARQLGVPLGDIYVAKSRVIKLLRQTIASLSRMDDETGIHL